MTRKDKLISAIDTEHTAAKKDSFISPIYYDGYADELCHARAMIDGLPAGAIQNDQTLDNIAYWCANQSDEREGKIKAANDDPYQDYYAGCRDALLFIACLAEDMNPSRASVEFKNDKHG